MRVPAGVELAELVPDDGDESAARFDQAARLEAALAEQRHAVLLAQAARLLAEVERRPYLRRVHQREGPAALGVERPRCRAGVELPPAPVELLDERPPLRQPVERHPRRHLRLRRDLESALRRDAEVRIVDLRRRPGRHPHHAPRRGAAEVGPERIVGVAEVRRVGPGVVRRGPLAAEQEREDDVVRDGPRGLGPVSEALVVLEDGAEVRLVLGVLLRLLDGDAAFGEAGRGPHHAVEVPRMIQGADDGDAVHHLRHVRQVFAHVAARQRRADRLEGAARLGRRCRLHVERVELARPAEQVEEDDVLRLAEAGFLRPGRVGRLPEEFV